MEQLAYQFGMELSPIYKGTLTFFCSLLIPLSAVFFINIRRSKKQKEFDRVVQVLGIGEEQADFAHDRVTEQFAARDYYSPVAIAWLLSILGFYGLFFGADLVSEHEDKPNFVLTGVLALGENEMQRLRLQSMVVLVWGYLGAFLWALLNITRRLNAGDLAPSAYLSTAIRFILAPAISLAIALLIEASPEAFEKNIEGALPAMAFLVGFFPDEALLYLRQRTPFFSETGRNASHRLPLSMIEGITVFDRARLDELEINDAQNLATADLVEIMVRTPFSPGKVIDWMAQARLYIYFKDDIVTLRKNQVRSIFDLITLGAEVGRLKALAERSNIALSGLELVCEQAQQEPRIRQLIHFKNLLSYGTAESNGQSHQPVETEETARVTNVESMRA